MLDLCLSWNDNIDLISTKLSSRLGMLREAGRGIPREACITLYDTMILSLFDYLGWLWKNKPRRTTWTNIKGVQLVSSRVAKYNTMKFSDIQVPQWSCARLPVARFSLFARLSRIQHTEQGPSPSASNKDH